VRGFTTYILAYNSMGEQGKHCPGFLSQVRVEWTRSSVFLLLFEERVLMNIAHDLFYVSRRCGFAIVGFVTVCVDLIPA